MKGIEFAILRSGVGVDTFAGHEQGAWYYCVLVKHPQAGYFMFDVGIGPADDTFRRPEAHIRQCPVTIPREEYVDKALNQLGLTVNDISAIIISHCHWDHFGGLTFFKNTEAIKHVYVCEADFKDGLFRSHRTAKGYLEPCDFYYRWNFDVEGAEFHMITGDTEIFPGVELRILKGHTEGVLAMILHMENDTYIFPSDTIPRSENYEDPQGHIHFTTVDVGEFRKSVDAVRQWQRQYSAKLMFPHDDRPIAGYVPHFVR